MFLLSHVSQQSMLWPPTMIVCLSHALKVVPGGLRLKMSNFTGAHFQIRLANTHLSNLNTCSADFHAACAFLYLALAIRQYCEPAARWARFSERPFARSEASILWKVSGDIMAPLFSRFRHLRSFLLIILHLSSAPPGFRLQDFFVWPYRLDSRPASAPVVSSSVRSVGVWS